MMTLPTTAMILAAGLGTRMRPLSEDRPKALIEVAGRALIDHALDRLVEAGVTRAVVNLHDRGEAVRAHLAKRDDLDLDFSDESEALLDTGGGVARARPMLGEAPVLVVNADALWFDASVYERALQRLGGQFDTERMDMILLLMPTVAAVGYDGVGDFNLATDGRLSRRPEPEVAPFVFTGVQILDPACLDDVPEGAFSLNLVYDRAADKGRLFGLRHYGDWFCMNTPDSVRLAERQMSGEDPLPLT